MRTSRRHAGGALSPDDIRFLTFTSGYATFNSCTQTDTVGSCAVSGSNGSYTPPAAGKFFYADSHMQTYAANFMGLGAQANASLAGTIINGLGLSANAADFLVYTTPISRRHQHICQHLRRVFTQTPRPQFVAGTQLNANANAVCTNSQTCATALYSPFPATESPNYSISHWVEDRSSETARTPAQARSASIRGSNRPRQTTAF